MQRLLPPKVCEADTTLAGWRHSAADLLLAASTAVHLPPLVLVLLGHGPPLPWLLKAAGVTAYLVMAAAAVLRRIDWRARVFACFISAYVVIFLASVVRHGPYAHVGLVINPILVLVLCGSRPAGIAALASVVILVSSPFLRLLAGVQALVTDSAQWAGPPGVIWFEAAVVAAFLVTVMVLLDRFHQFLLETLAVRHEAKDGLERELRERQRLEREIARIGDEERRRLGRELHDGVCQQIAASLLHCETLRRRVGRGGTTSDEDFAALSSLLTQTVNDAHNVANGLCPLDGDSGALTSAIEELVKRAQAMEAVRCEFVDEGDVRVPDAATARHLYRIAQEAMSNALRHSHASRIVVELRGSKDDVLLEIADDGVGMPAGFCGNGLGLRTMAYRAQILGATFAVTPAPSGGTRVSCRVPRSTWAALQDHDGDRQWTGAA